MPTLIIAAIFLAIVVIICLLLISVERKQKRKCMNGLLNRFSKLGSEHNLAFSSQTMLKKYIIGLDGVHRKLLVLNAMPENTTGHFLIDLEEVRCCSVKKVYGSITNGSLKKQRLDQYLEKISLCFEFKTVKEPIEILFYSNIDNAPDQASALEQRARDWEIVLSKMLSRSLKKIA